MNTSTQPNNIVLIIADQWRGDCLGVADNPIVQTPHLDEFFFRGVQFTRAYTACPSCIAARAGLLTGMSPRSHGRVGYQDHVNWTYRETLPASLTQAGYQTHCVGKMHVHPPRNLMGFHSVDLHDGTVGATKAMPYDWSLYDDYYLWLKDRHGTDADLQDTGLGANSWAVNPWPYDEMSHPTNWVATKSIDFLRRRDTTKPFFLKMSFVRPHPPFDPPQHFLDRYAHQDLPPIPRGDWLDDPQDTARLGLRTSFGCGAVRPDMADLARRAYYALITHIDHQIGRFMLAMHRYRLLENTIFIFTSDHGELLGDHNRYAKSMPFEGSAHIPFLLRFPDNHPGPHQLTIDQPVELRDIFPTCCDIAQAPVPSSVEGQSLLPLIENPQHPWRSYLHGEHSSGQMSNHWLTDGKEKYAWFPLHNRELLFDLTADPQELHDLSTELPDRTAFWRRRLITELDGREEGFVKNGKLNTNIQPQNILKQSGWFD